MRHHGSAGEYSDTWGFQDAVVSSAAQKVDKIGTYLIEEKKVMFDHLS